MKKTITILAVIFLFASCEPKIVYVTKPTLNDSTVLKAEMKLSEWKITAFNTIQQKSVAMYYLQDTTEKKKAFDTIMMAINYIDKNIGDSNRNPIFKK